MSGGELSNPEPQHSPAADRRAQGVQRTTAERNRLLTAASEVLQRSGWWGFKVESVLRQAGLSTRSFYRHFEKKNDLLMALLDAELSGAAIRLRRATAAAATPPEQVQAYVTATIDMAYRQDLVKRASVFALHWRELLPEYPEAIERCAELVRAPLVEAITEGQARGLFHSDDPVADAKAIYQLVTSMTADQAALRGVDPREDIERIVMPFIGRALKAR